MIGLKRFIRPGLVVSAIGHGGALAVGLLLVAAHPFQSPPPPEAMVVDIVPPNDVPRLQGTPSDLRTSGSEQSSKSNSASAVAQAPPPKPAAQSPQQPQQRPDPQPEAHRTMARPETARADTAPPEKAETETAEPPPAPPQPPLAPTPDQPETAEMIAQLALAGGPLGGGFAAPPVDAAKATDDFLAAFREHVSRCSILPAGIAPGEDISIVLRVLINRDGTLASTPHLLKPIATEKQQALFQNSISALEKCQPYTMLPAEKYKQWKKLDLVFFPMSFLGR